MARDRQRHPEIDVRTTCQRKYESKDLARGRNGGTGKRFAALIDDPLRQWKLSPMDVECYSRWYDYSRARDEMLKATDSRHAPWYMVRTDDKRRSRLKRKCPLSGVKRT